jgi:hypothetical protein
VKHIVRRAALLGALGALACGPLLGLDDLSARPVASDAGETEAGDGNVVTGACIKHADCFQEGAEMPSICVAKQCVRLDRNACSGDVFPSREILKDPRLDEKTLLLITAFVPLGGGAIPPLAQKESLTYQFAVDEIRKAGGIQSDPPREIALTFCNSEPSKVVRSVDHVMKELHVPAVLANFEGGDLSRAITIAKETQTFVLNPNPPDEATKYRDVDRLVWNLLGTAEDVALAYAPLVARAQASGKFPATTMKVALVRADAALEESIAEVIKQGPLVRDPAGDRRDPSRALKFNGKSTTENGSNFREVVLRQTDTGEFDFTTALNALSALTPDLILLLTKNDRGESLRIVSDYELRTAEAGTPPRWILGPRNAFAVKEFIQKKPGAESRFTGIQYAGPVNDAERTKWLGRLSTAPRYQARYDELQSLENFYDAVYWIAYGLAAAGPGQPITGESIKGGVRRLLNPSGPDVLAGPIADIQSAFDRLRFGKARFVGALGPPDIDEAFGTWNSVGATYCYRKSTQSPFEVTIDYNVARYSYTGTLSTIGDQTCDLQGL